MRVDPPATQTIIILVVLISNAVRPARPAVQVRGTRQRTGGLQRSASLLQGPWQYVHRTRSSFHACGSSAQSSCARRANGSSPAVPGTAPVLMRTGTPRCACPSVIRILSVTSVPVPCGKRSRSSSRGSANERQRTRSIAGAVRSVSYRGSAGSARRSRGWSTGRSIHRWSTSAMVPMRRHDTPADR